MLSLLVTAVAAAAGVSPSSEGAVMPAQTALDDETFLTVIFATFGASVGAAVLATIGYFIRRGLGADWHRSRAQGPYDIYGNPRIPDEAEPHGEATTHAAH